MPDTPTTAVTPEWRKVDAEVYMMLLQHNDALREHMMVLVKENEAQATELVALKQPIPCGVCGGRPLPSERKCVCGGVGTEQAEMQGLRAACFEYEDELAALRARVEEMALQVFGEYDD